MENMPVCEKPMADTIEADGVAAEEEIYEAAQPNDTAAVPDPEEESVYMEMAQLQARHGRPRGRLQTPCIGPLLKKEGISWRTLATIVYAAVGNLNPNCCSYCFHIVYHKEFRDDESDDDDDDDKADSGHGLEHETSAEEGVRPLTPPLTPTPPEVQYLE
ncbi:uncharacterized protein LOC125424930 isoform X2 [Sphaerodactylus townsendi]|uniref:uncharacterized protein LOC125424930 isoform X2 n=1 Tax=Sphaerodactylus townsendi TaxID=933632 RepID=UPI0020271D18|nr:uncharacterized protein LOC125424930 isoform X2 [Sphaerodactylus townsendi]